MEIFIYGLASLVLLVPVLYFLPLGLTGKGKVMIAGTSVFLAIAGGYGNSIFNSLQLALILLLLTGLAAYIFDRKLGAVFFTEESVFDEVAEIENGSSAHILSQKTIEDRLHDSILPIENNLSDMVSAGEGAGLSGAGHTELDLDEISPQPSLSDNEKTIEPDETVTDLAFFDDLEILEPSLVLPVSSNENVERFTNGEQSVKSIGEGNLDLPLLDFDSIDLEISESGETAPALKNEYDRAGDEDYFAALVEAAVASENKEEDLVKSAGARNG
ncbi:hypothetical protein D1B31_10630 [Neobacillus notoginsengisoli]|uniref:Uncharacterized protein n=1 Tax=Neobacillus notoginsengisoli TaxID=1578198 RepID=A0A417YTZ3_9BACI|nr:hypothetical protein [Neobacillus notoginsengisoli]RHW40646.1 hypothetical protein D1B31_10630 [Neobacillus notoginsengisoli]